jgi:hypothetical protein
VDETPDFLFGGELGINKGGGWNAEIILIFDSLSQLQSQHVVEDSDRCIYDIGWFFDSEAANSEAAMHGKLCILP